MPQEIHLSDIDINIIQTNRYGERTYYKGKVEEIWMDQERHPYQITISFGGMRKRIQPKFENRKMIFSTRLMEYEIEVDE
jgi:hypothetical protein